MTYNYYIVISEEGVHAVCESEESAKQIISSLGKGRIVVMESRIDPETFVWSLALDRNTYRFSTDTGVIK